MADPPSPTEPLGAGRVALGLAAAAATAAVGAVIFGEYDYRGVTAVVGSVLYGVAVAEVLVIVVKRPPPPPLLLTLTGLVAGGLVWAAWIAFNHFRRDVPAGTWASVALGVAVAVGWALTGRSTRRSGRPRSAGPMAASGGEPSGGESSDREASS